ncbi:DNA-binding transcriptional regulator [Helicobacter sp. MIT 14-3879]|uniref:helix-turn-helix domain-containing protein n=1 Tax=Helicobacter sp. MIT 14-3879 TaxID=2040649 RepID=UPI000E1F60F1|nr:helix-turn-helix transcriptional regulator [Helicobacter sp. MIT 14-3879]RDU65593.1 acyl carrier protein [Helicobacter sp. MIT 14-3879]
MEHLNQRELKVLLSKANLSKKEFAKMVGISQQSVNNWGSSKNVPYWVKSYLQNYIKLKQYEDIREKIEELGIFNQI